MRRKQRGCAAAEKERFSLAHAHPRRVPTQIGNDRIEQRRLIAAARPIDVEIAIGTNARAIRPMDIDAQTHFSAATSFAKARARWLIACFASGSISPKV